MAQLSSPRTGSNDAIPEPVQKAGSSRRLLSRVRFKELTQIYWQGGARKTAVRLLVVGAGGLICTSKNGRQILPAAGLSADHRPEDRRARLLLQAYLIVRQLRVKSSDEKDILGVGEAQVWNAEICQQSARLLVAMYSWLLLAGLKML